MIFDFFKSFTSKKTKKNLQNTKQYISLTLKEIALKNNFYFYENIEIIDKNQLYPIAAILFDIERGIFIFENKNWNFEDLKNATIEKSKNQTSNQNTLAFDQIHQLFTNKFHSLAQENIPPIYNFLILEYLSVKNYNKLPSSFQELLAHNKIFFAKESYDEISQKIFQIKKLATPYDLTKILTTLLPQFCIVDGDTKHIASVKQSEFINSHLEKISTLHGEFGSGKSSAVIVKAILEKLRNPELKIAIIKPTQLACYLMMKKMRQYINTIKIEINEDDIHIVTCNNFFQNDPNFDGLIICDDTDVYPQDYLKDFQGITGKHNTIIVGNTQKTPNEFVLPASFRNAQESVFFQTQTPNAKTLQIISQLLQTYAVSEILVLSSRLNNIKLYDDLKYFIEDEAKLLDSTQIIHENVNVLYLGTYDAMYHIDPKCVILMDFDFLDTLQFQYAYFLAREKVYVVYENENENLDLIRKNFENNKNS